MAERDERGRLKKGHGGLKPKGAVSEKTKQWEALADAIVGLHAERFNSIMEADYVDSMDHEDEELKAAARARFTSNYIKTLDFVKPKLQRVTQVGEEGAPPVQIVISERIANKI